MTNEQYKGLLIDRLNQWQELKELAEKENAVETAKKAEKQIKNINEKLKF